MDSDELRRRREHLETATDAAVMSRELEWKKSGLSDEELAPEYNEMFRRLKALNKRSLEESLEHTDPKALFDMVRYAKHLGMWKGYEENRSRLRYLEGA